MPPRLRKQPALHSLKTVPVAAHQSTGATRDPIHPAELGQKPQALSIGQR
jgi:hypothetical protein